MKISKGSIYQDKKSNYLFINLSIDGKRKRFATGTTNENEAKEVLEDIKKGLKNGTINLNPKAPKKTFEYYSKNFLDMLSVKSTTLKAYKSRLNRWIEEFKDREISSITAGEIKRFLFDLNIKKRSMSNHLICVSGVFREALLDEVIQRNPCDLVKLKRSKERDEEAEIFPFTIDEVERLIANSSGWFQSYLATAFYTGARIGELFALKWQNVDFEKERIYIDATRGNYAETTTKTGKTRYIPLFKILKPYLLEQRARTGMKTYVFLTPNGANITPSNARANMWIPLLKRLSIPYRRMYQTRHTFATNMLNSGKLTLNQVASMLAHANIQMLTLHYYRYIEDENSKIDTGLDPFCQSFCQSSRESA